MKGVMFMAMRMDTVYSVYPRRIPSRAKRRELASFLFFVSPWMLGFCLVTILPLIWGFYLSMTNFTGLGFERLRFMGMFNYLRALRDTQAWEGLKHTAVITLTGVPLNLVAGFGLAVLLNQKVFNQKLYRTFYYIPSVMPVVAMAVIWQTIYGRNAGLLNALLDIFHTGTVINWISEFPNQALIFMRLWGVGGGMIIYLAALQGVPRELKDAAAIDGATPWQSFWRVTFPLVTPVIFFQLVMGIIQHLQLLVPAMLLTHGGFKAVIPEANRLYMVHLFEQTFVYYRYSYGLALAWILFLVVFAFSLIVVKSGQFWVHYEVDVEERRTQS